MPGEWPPVCETLKHRGRAIPAVDRYIEKKANVKYYLCAECSGRIGGDLLQKGWKYQQLTKRMMQGTIGEHEE